MSSNQMEIQYIISRLKTWNQTLGGEAARKKLSGSQFDYLQQQFLIKRHEVQQLQNDKQLQGLTTKTASHSYKIRQGVAQMQTAVGRMKEEHRKLAKKKIDTPEVLVRKQKIIENCEKLLEDVEERQKLNNDPNHFSQPNKVMTLTDMRAKLLEDIDEQNYQIHQGGSDGRLTENNQEQMEAVKQFKKKDEQMDDVLDGIIEGIIGVTGKVKGINKKQDQIIDKTKKNKKQVQDTSKRIETDNDKLKKIIKQFGTSRCCMFIVLLLLLVGLIVIIIKMFVLG